MGKGRKTSVFEHYLAGSLMMGLEGWLEACYKKVKWPSSCLQEDLIILQNEYIDSIDTLKSALERGYLRNCQTALNPLSIDLLSAEAGVGIKCRFEKISDEKRDAVDRFITENSQKLSNSRIFNIETLQLISCKSWKKNKLIPIGLKVNLENICDQETSAITEFSHLNITSTSDNRMKVATSDGLVYEADRYCPHKGADMLGAPVTGSIITCPRHSWEFDLSKGGQCVKGKRLDCSINSKVVDW